MTSNTTDLLEFLVADRISFVSDGRHFRNSALASPFFLVATLLDKYRLAAARGSPRRIGLAPWLAHPAAYVAGRTNWSARWEGIYVCRHIEGICPGTAEIVDRPHTIEHTRAEFCAETAGAGPELDELITLWGEIWSTLSTPEKSRA